MRGMRDSLKRVASRFPPRVQWGMQRSRYWWQIRTGEFFEAHEAEFYRLEEWVKEGDFVIDVGANVGQYTARLSTLVGPTGRVLAFEPIPDTFELLAFNMALVGATNVSLFNAALSSQTRSVGMSIPKFDTGLSNRWGAYVTSDAGQLTVMSMTLDSLSIPTRVALIKIDIEGHELQALLGMRELLTRDHPTLIVEGWSVDVQTFLSGLGYGFEQAPDSWNRVYQSKDRRDAPPALPAGLQPTLP
jgi:FkbM family methyltransferase